MKSLIRIGTRGSQLALYQAHYVREKITRNFPLITVEIQIIKTSGDMIRRGHFDPITTKRVFTREIEDALLKGEVDLAVHSAKDMSVHMPEGLELGAVFEREDPSDCLISKDHKKLSELPLGARIGTSSMRRKKQLLRWNPELIIEDCRGNVDSRIKKVESGQYDAIVLALAGVKRLGLSQYIAEVLPEHQFYPSPGQGTIVAQSRIGNEKLQDVLHAMNHHESEIRLRAERAFLRKLEGGCQLPCGALSHIEGNELHTKGALFAVEGHAFSEGVCKGLASEPEEVGTLLAESVLAGDGQKILDEIRKAEA